MGNKSFYSKSFLKTQCGGFVTGQNLIFQGYPFKLVSFLSFLILSFAFRISFGF
jgi:hypothetical protein